MKLKNFTAIALLIVTLGGTAEAVGPYDYLSRTFTDSTGFEIPYRLFVPPDYDASNSYPIVMYLHGAAGRGTDNLKHMSGGNTLGSTVWAEPINQLNHPTFVLAPQAPLVNFAWGRMGQPVSSAMQASLQLLDYLEMEFNIDTHREYVTGQSMGGIGTWAALAAQPGRFAAGVPLAGSGKPNLASEIASIPQWVFHGELDAAVSVDRSRQMVSALTSAEGSPVYTEYDNLGHAIWNTAYATPELHTWLFSQSTPVPEPSTVALLAIGCSGLLIQRRKRE